MGSDGRLTWIGKYMERSSSGIITVLFQNLPGRTGKSHKFQSGDPVSRPRFKSSTSSFHIASLYCCQFSVSSCLTRLPLIKHLPKKKYFKWSVITTKKLFSSPGYQAREVSLITVRNVCYSP